MMLIQLAGFLAFVFVVLDCLFAGVILYLLVIFSIIMTKIKVMPEYKSQVRAKPIAPVKIGVNVCPMRQATQARTAQMLIARPTCFLSVIIFINTGTQIDAKM